MTHVMQNRAAIRLPLPQCAPVSALRRFQKASCSGPARRPRASAAFLIGEDRCRMTGRSPGRLGVCDQRLALAFTVLRRQIPPRIAQDLPDLQQRHRCGGAEVQGGGPRVALRIAPAPRATPCPGPLGHGRQQGRPAERQLGALAERARDRVQRFQRSFQVQPGRHSGWPWHPTLAGAGRILPEPSCCNEQPSADLRFFRFQTTDSAVGWHAPFNFVHDSGARAPRPHFLSVDTGKAAVPACALRGPHRGPGRLSGARRLIVARARRKPDLIRPGIARVEFRPGWMQADNSYSLALCVGTPP